MKQGVPALKELQEVFSMIAKQKATYLKKKCFCKAKDVLSVEVISIK